MKVVVVLSLMTGTVVIVVVRLAIGPLGHVA